MVQSDTCKCHPLWFSCDPYFNTPIRCVCPANYTNDASGFNCIPLCTTYGCSSTTGTCIAPDVCACKLGWTGSNCTTNCGCNGHSTCDISGPGYCDYCYNNTVGAHCESCQPGYFGNATNGGNCLTCFQECNGHTNVCNSNATATGSVCQSCSNNTVGSFCEQCAPGYFYSPSILLAAAAANMNPVAFVTQRRAVSACVPCFCNGHAGTCNPVNGTNCQCGNNTLTPTSPGCLGPTCYQRECSICQPTINLHATNPVLSLFGSPSNGAQCYAVVDSKNYVQGGIDWASVATFEVVPLYNNVDLRIVLEVDNGLPGAAGSVVMYISRVPNATVSTTSGLVQGSSGPLQLQFGDVPLRYEISGGSVVVILSKDQYLFDITRFFIVVVGGSSSTMQYGFYFLQPTVNIDLFVFFSVFFSAFFLLLGVVIIYVVAVHHVRRVEGRRREEREMEGMANRPMGAVRLLMPRGDFVGPRAVLVAENIRQRKLAIAPCTIQTTR